MDGRNLELCQGMYGLIRQDMARLAVAEKPTPAGYQMIARDAGYGVTDGEEGFSWYTTDYEAGDPEHREGRDVYPAANDAWEVCCTENKLLPEDTDEFRRTIIERTYGVEVRSGWYEPGQIPMIAEFKITLATGGPAVEVYGDYDGRPHNVKMRVEGNGIGWEDYEPADPDMGKVLVYYAGLFYFGD